MSYVKPHEASIIWMVLEKDEELWKLKLFVSIQNKMASVWSIDVFYKVKVWERLYKF